MLHLISANIQGHAISLNIFPANIKCYSNTIDNKYTHQQCERQRQVLRDARCEKDNARGTDVMTSHVHWHYMCPNAVSHPGYVYLLSIVIHNISSFMANLNNFFFLEDFFKFCHSFFNFIFGFMYILYS